MTKYKREWKLPKPIDHGDHFEWKPVVRISRHLPFGYKEDPKDKDVLLPIPEELELLEQAKKHLKRYSYRAVAAWLSEQSKRPITHVGLYKRIKLEQKRKTEASIQRFYAQRYEEAIKKAQALEARVGGAATKSSVDRTSESTAAED